MYETDEAKLAAVVTELGYAFASHLEDGAEWVAFNQPAPDGKFQAEFYDENNNLVAKKNYRIVEVTS